MVALNAKCFSQKHWEVMARGFNVTDWFEHDKFTQNGGIANPIRDDLKVGQRYFRFANSTSPKEYQFGGGWWIDFETFDFIDELARKLSVDVTKVARNYLALPYEWTRVDRLISGYLAAPLDCYAGKGRTAFSSGQDARDAGTKYIPPQHVEIKQLFVPGLYSRSKSPSDAAQPFRIAFPDAEAQFLFGKRDKAYSNSF